MKRVMVVIWLKSFVAGIAVTFFMALFALVCNLLFLRFRHGLRGAIGIDPTGLARDPTVWVYLLISFLAGFVIAYRRLSS